MPDAATLPEVPAAEQSEMLARADKLKSPDNRARAKVLVVKYLCGETNKWENTELADMGLLKRETAPGMANGVNKEFCTQTEMAEILTEQYGRARGTVITKDRVSKTLARWRKEKYPWLSKVDYRHDKSLCVREFLKHYEELETAAGNAEIASREASDARTALHRANREARRDKEEERKFSLRWMLTSAFEFFCEAFGVTARNTARDLAERNIRMAVEAIIKEEVVDVTHQQKILERLQPLYATAFEQWQSEFVSRLEELAKEANENSEKEKRELK
jgi:hypothetical protein